MWDLRDVLTFLALRGSDRLVSIGPLGLVQGLNSDAPISETIMWKVFGGIALAFVAWQVINLRPVDLMTDPCKAELTENHTRNETLRTAITAAQAGREVVIGGVHYRGAKALPPIATEQANLKDRMDSFDKRCKLF